jgi:hypothetical protein
MITNAMPHHWSATASTHHHQVVITMHMGITGWLAGELQTRLHERGHMRNVLFLPSQQLVLGDLQTANDLHTQIASNNITTEAPDSAGLPIEAQGCDDRETFMIKPAQKASRCCGPDRHLENGTAETAEAGSLKKKRHPLLNLQHQASGMTAYQGIACC